MGRKNEYFISVNGQTAVDLSYKLIGNRCVAPLIVNGKRVAQIEVVIDNDGQYNGRPNKWVDFSFIKEEDIKTVKNWLSDNGFSGCYAFIAQSDENENPINETEIKLKKEGNKTMKTTMKLHSKYFYGNEVSEEGQKYNRLDYGTLSKAFNHVMCNDLMNKTADIGYWEPVSGYGYWNCDEDDDRCETEVFQWFIVDSQGAKILEECEEIVFYNEELDIYLWGVTHCGTSWDYVLTDIPINVPYEEGDE